MRSHRESKDELNLKDKQPLRTTNTGILQVGWLLLRLACLCAGAFFLLGGKNIGFSVLLLLIGLWLVLDNPLESFEILEDTCPSCGHKVKVRHRIKRRCPACRRTIVVGSEGLHDKHHDNHKEDVYLPGRRVLVETVEKHTQVEPVVIRPGDTLDLHTFSPKEVVSLLGEFIELSQEADVRVVKIIHGKGTGILRRRVRGVLARDPRVIAFYDASPMAGGWGATLVELRSGLADDYDKAGV